MIDPWQGFHLSFYEKYHTLKFGRIRPSLHVTKNRINNSPESPCPVAGDVASDSLQSRSWNSRVDRCESWTSIRPNFPGDWIRTSGERLRHRSFQLPFRNQTVKKKYIKLNLASLYLALSHAIRRHIFRFTSRARKQSKQYGAYILFDIFSVAFFDLQQYKPPAHFNLWSGRQKRWRNASNEQFLVVKFHVKNQWKKNRWNLPCGESPPFGP